MNATAAKNEIRIVGFIRSSWRNKRALWEKEAPQNARKRGKDCNTNPLKATSLIESAITRGSLGSC